MPEEAHAMECLGWILMYALRTGMRRVKQPAWWVPPAPAFAAEYPDPGPPLADTISQVIRTTGSVDTTLKKFPIYRRLFSRWDSGIAGSMWRMETGARKSQFGFPPGLPFYPEVLPNGIPRDMKLPTPSMQRIDAVWLARVRSVGAVDSKDKADILRKCGNSAVTSNEFANAFASASLGGIRLTADRFPVLDGRRQILHRVTVLAQAAPTITALFEALAALGWNDLLLESAGTLCFRGVKLKWIATKAERYYKAAQRLSTHGYGLAIDVNDFENPKVAPPVIDPRIVAIFEAFHFDWGLSFPETDPHHFDLVRRVFN